jgi:hypothetical protein
MRTQAPSPPPAAHYRNPTGWDGQSLHDYSALLVEQDRQSRIRRGLLERLGTAAAHPCEDSSTPQVPVRGPREERGGGGAAAAVARAIAAAHPSRPHSAAADQQSQPPSPEPLTVADASDCTSHDLPLALGGNPASEAERAPAAPHSVEIEIDPPDPDEAGSSEASGTGNQSPGADLTAEVADVLGGFRGRRRNHPVTARSATSDDDDDDDNDGAAAAAAASLDVMEAEAQLIIARLRSHASSDQDYASLQAWLYATFTEFNEWMGACRTDNQLHGPINFMPLEKMHDEIDRHVGATRARSVMRPVVQLLELGGFRKSLLRSDDGSSCLHRWLTFEPSKDSIMRLQIASSIAEAENARCRNWRATAAVVTPDVSSTTSTSVTDEAAAGDSPSDRNTGEVNNMNAVSPDMAVRVEATESLASSPTNAPEVDQLAPAAATRGGLSVGGTEGGKNDQETVSQTDPFEKPTSDAARQTSTLVTAMRDQWKFRIAENADQLASLLLDEVIHETAGVMQKFSMSGARSVSTAGPDITIAETTARVDWSLFLRTFRQLEAEESELLRKYTARTGSQPLSPPREVVALSGPTESAQVSLSATREAHTNAHLALAARHYEERTLAEMFWCWKAEALVDAPRLTVIMFSSVVVRVKKLLPRWCDFAALNAKAFSFAVLYCCRRYLRMLQNNTARVRLIRVAVEHHVDWVLCDALARWHRYIKEQLLTDSAKCAKMALVQRSYVMARKWQLWQSAENTLLAHVHSRRCILYRSTYQWRHNMQAVQRWRCRWVCIVLKLSVCSWKQYCWQQRTQESRLERATRHWNEQAASDHFFSWLTIASRRRTLWDKENRVRSRSNVQAQRVALRAFKQETRLSIHRSAIALRGSSTIWHAWANECKVVKHMRSRAWEAWKVWVGMVRLDSWLAQVRYTIHGRWVLVDSFYEWKQLVTMSVLQRQLLKRREQTTKFRCLRKWTSEYSVRASNGIHQIEPKGSDATAADSENGESVDAEAASVVARRTEEIVHIEELVAKQVAGVQHALETQYGSLHKIQQQQQNLLSGMSMNISALTQQLTLTRYPQYKAAQPNATGAESVSLVSDTPLLETLKAGRADSIDMEPEPEPVAEARCAERAATEGQNTAEQASNEIIVAEDAAGEERVAKDEQRLAVKAAQAETAQAAEEQQLAAETVAAEAAAAAEAEAARIAAEKRVAEEKAAAEVEAARIAAEKSVAEEKAAAEAEAARIAAEKRVAEEKAAAEVESARIVAEKRAAEEKAAAEAQSARIAAEKRVAKEKARLAAESNSAPGPRLATESQPDRDPGLNREVPVAADVEVGAQDPEPGTVSTEVSREADVAPGGTEELSPKQLEKLAKAAQSAAKKAGVANKVKDSSKKKVDEHPDAAEKFREGATLLKSKEFAAAKRHFDESIAAMAATAPQAEPEPEPEEPAEPEPTATESDPVSVDDGIEELRATFARIDTDDSGELDLEELMELIKELLEDEAAETDDAAKTSAKKVIRVHLIRALLHCMVTNVLCA